MFVDVILMTGARGGIENILNFTGADLLQRGFRVRFVQMVSSDKVWHTSGIDFVCLGLDREVFSFEDARRQYASLLREGYDKPDLIFSVGWPYLSYVAKGAATDASLAVPVAAWLHGDIHFLEEGGCGGMDMLQFADICFVINNQIAADIYDTYPDKVIYRVYNPINTDSISYSEDRNRLKLACVSRLSHEKALPILLYALERTHEPWTLEIIGDGSETDALVSLTRELGLENRVRFHGWSDRPWEIVTDCRALVVTSLYEGGPVTVTEALYCGMQVISTPVGFVPEIVTDSRIGILTPFGDVQALTDALDRLAATGYTRETALACRDSVTDYLPMYALYDFYKKTEASIALTGLAERFVPGKRDLMIRPDRSSL